MRNILCYALIFVCFTNCSKKFSNSNASDFGAKGNGITDDYIALQRAINAATKDVILEKKTYLVSQSLQLKSNINLLGNGATIIIHPKAEINLFSIDAKNNISISDLSIVGQKNIVINAKSTGRNRNLIFCRASNNIRLSNLNFKDHSFTTTHFSDVSNLKISNCNFSDIGQTTSWEKFPYYSYDCIFIGGYKASVNIEIENCTFSNIGWKQSNTPNNDGDGIHIQGSNGISPTNITVRGCTFSHCGARGIKIQSGASLEIVSNKFETSYAGISMTMVNNLNQVTIAQNSFDSIQYAIATNHKGYEASNVYIKDNTSNKCIFFFRTSGGSKLVDSEISRNVVTNLGRCFIDGLMYNVEIIENTIKGYAGLKDKSYHMAILVADSSNGIKILDNNITATKATTTAIYVQANIKTIEVQNNDINIPQNNPTKYIIIDHSKSIDSKDNNIKRSNN